MRTARPKYRKSKGTSKVDIATATLDIENVKGKSEPKPALEIPQLNTQKSLRQTIKEVKLVHVRLAVLYSGSFLVCYLLVN